MWKDFLESLTVETWKIYHKIMNMEKPCKISD